MSFILPIAGPFFFLSMQVSTLQTARTINTRKSVGSLPLMPFFSLFVNCVIWALYGVLKEDNTVLLPNLIGIFVGGYCTYIYHIHSSHINKNYSYIICCIIIFITLILYSNNNSDWIGNIGCFLAVSVMSSPLASMSTVIQQKSTESMPFYTSFSAFLNSLSWSLYGLYSVNDPYIYYPNLLGFFVTCIQMCLFIKYGLDGCKTSGLGVSESNGFERQGALGIGSRSGNGSGSDQSQYKFNLEGHESFGTDMTGIKPFKYKPVNTVDDANGVSGNGSGSIGNGNGISIARSERESDEDEEIPSWARQA